MGYPGSELAPDAEASGVGSYVFGRHRVTEHHVDKFRRECGQGTSEQPGHTNGHAQYSDRLRIEQTGERVRGHRVRPREFEGPSWRLRIESCAQGRFHHVVSV